MPELTFFIVLLAVAGWLISRRGKRRARKLLFRLAFERGGQYFSGGLFGTPRTELAVGSKRLSISLSPATWTGRDFWATLAGVWPHQRPKLDPSRPTGLRFAAASPAPSPRRLSDDLVQLGNQLEGLKLTSQDRLWTEREQVFYTVLLNSRQYQILSQWVDMGVQYYMLLIADTEAGIEFSSLTPGSDSAEVCCQICGVPPAANERVLCAACGTPHHLECWDYNQGCAIYGCRCRQHRRA